MRNVILLFLLIVGWTTTVCAQNEQETIEGRESSLIQRTNL